jgi:hypothetical protein
LDTTGVYNIRDAFSSDVCYRIAWAIIDDGRSYFSHVLIQQDFGKESVLYPKSLLDAILSDVRFANPIRRANYPKEWQPQLLRHSQQGPITRPLAPSWTPPTGHPPQQQAVAPTRSSSGARTAPQTWVDERHPKIVEMMSPYIEKFGPNVYVGEILDAAGIRVDNLPVPTGTRFASKDGTRAYVCWNAVLGQCKFGKGCKYRKNHPGKGDLPDSYVTSVVAALQDAVSYVISSKESPLKKPKIEIIA